MSPQHRHLNEPVAIKVGGTRSSAISPHNARARSSANEKKRDSRHGFVKFGENIRMGRKTVGTWRGVNGTE